MTPGENTLGFNESVSDKINLTVLIKIVLALSESLGFVSLKFTKNEILMGFDLIVKGLIYVFNGFPDLVPSKKKKKRFKSKANSQTHSWFLCETDRLTGL